MTIEISEELKDKIIDFCTDELNYHINECDFADEYDTEIVAQIELLYRLGEKKLARDYKLDYARALTVLAREYDEKDLRAECREKKKALTKLWSELATNTRR